MNASVEAAAGPRVGVLVVGHGDSASHILAAARAIVADTLDDVIALDAGAGSTAQFEGTLREHVARADSGRGVLLVVDLLGASPCSCGIRCGDGHELTVIAGLNLAMLLKLATVDRRTITLHDLAAACADSARRAVVVREAAPEPGDGGRP